jgi:ribonuclease J
MDRIRIFALGGLDEDGKNCYVLDINDQWFVIESGVKYPDGEQLGVEVVIPDFSILIENKDKVKGVFITHGHDDVMGALPYLLKQADFDVYTTPLTACLVEDLLTKHKIKSKNIHRIKRFGTFKVAGIPIRSFGMTQSIPDGFGLAFETKHGYIVYTSESMIDFNNKHDSFSSDISEFAEIGKKKVLALLTESVSADREGFTAPSHLIADQLESAFDQAKGRIIVSMYKQNVYRLMEIIELANQFKRKIVFYNKNQRRYTEHLEHLKYYKMPVNSEISIDNYDNDLENVVVIVAANGPNVFKMMHKIAMNEDDHISLRSSDTVILASPAVPNTEVEAASMENELYKEGCKVVSFDHKKTLSMHGSKEDIKMLINLFKPEYYIPIKGQYRHLVNNANLAFDNGFKAGNIIVLDNGMIASIEDGVYTRNHTNIEFEEILIDGMESLDVGGRVLKDREFLASDGAMIIGLVLNFKTKSIIGGPDVQSRGVIYLKDADHIVKQVAKIMEETIQLMVKENRYDNNSARMEAKDKISKYIYKATAKRPMILPVIIEINN